jgi:hypothetical protein
MPPDFPVAFYEAVYKKVERRASTVPDLYEQFAGAWNALAYRFLALAEHEAALTVSLANLGASPSRLERYRQERDLFGFFSNGFSMFEAAFYGLFSIGAFVSSAGFPMSTAKDRQRISPSSTAIAMVRAFSGDPLNKIISSAASDPAYEECREVRHILTHRAAPGRTFFVGLGTDDLLPDQWKIKSIPLDDGMPPARRADLARLIGGLLQGIDQFTKSQL